MEADWGRSKGRELYFASKALCGSFQLNVTSLYCSIRNTCVNIPQVLVQKVHGGKTGSVGAKNEKQ